jgi:DNA repair exonuclease SbcCD ATPase subunit
MEPHDETRQDVTGVAEAPAPASIYVTLEEAVLLFEDAGVFRSVRTLSRYCQHGVLDCTKEEMPSGAMRYLATRESVQNRIMEMQQIGASSHVQSRPDMTSHDAPRQDTARHDETEIKALEERIKELEQEKKNLADENRDLQIDVGIKKEVLRQTADKFERFTQERDTMLKHIGSLETQVKQIDAPQEAPATREPEHPQNAYEPASREYQPETIPSQPENEPNMVYNGQ